MEELYTIINSDNEQASREWLLSHSDTIDLTLADNGVPYFRIGLLLQVNRQMKGDIVNPESLATFKRIEPWFIRHEINNLRHGDCRQGKRTRIDHYYFQLSDDIKEMLNRQTLIWSFYDPDSPFQGFDDPVFYNEGKIMGYVISHHYQGCILNKL